MNQYLRKIIFAKIMKIGSNFDSFHGAGGLGTANVLVLSRAVN